MSLLQIHRGQVITVASPGAYSEKPRPALVVQTNRWLGAHPSITLCPLTSTLVEAPLVSIIDRQAAYVPIGEIGGSIGHLDTTVTAEFI